MSAMRALVFGVAMAAASAAHGEGYVPETYTLELAGSRQSVDVYRTLDVPSAGVAIVAHGFGRTRARHRDLGRALAEAGVTAVIPDLPSTLDLWTNGRALADLARSLERGAIPSLAVGRAHLILMGTSAGGLASLLAAVRLPGLAGWIGLDPTDRTGTGTAAAAQLAAPAVVMLAEPSLCNLMTSGRSIAEALPRRWRTVDVADASHCDFEDPTNNFCRAVCGGSSDATRAAIRAEIVTTARELLAASDEAP
jgi:dienelactone hydrolase